MWEGEISLCDYIIQYLALLDRCGWYVKCAGTSKAIVVKSPPQSDLCLQKARICCPTTSSASEVFIARVRQKET